MPNGPWEHLVDAIRFSEAIGVGSGVLRVLMVNALMVGCGTGVASTIIATNTAEL